MVAITIAKMVVITCTRLLVTRHLHRVFHSPQHETAATGDLPQTTARTTARENGEKLLPVVHHQQASSLITLSP